MDIQVNCPHCESMIIVAPQDINCAIFRHGAYKNTLEPINPHESKEICDKLSLDDLIYGCGKPFRMIKVNDNFNVEICDYL